MPSIELQPFRPTHDMPLIERWLRDPEVSRWWGESAQVQAALAGHPADHAALIHVDGVAVGLLCWQIPTRRELADAGLDDLPADLVDIDIVIGEAGMRGQGLGPLALELLFERLRREGVKLVGVATALGNSHALAAYARVGLQPYRDFFELGEDYRYLTRHLDNPGQPSAG
ncbi:GNAT family N-acetyltransferase [Pseudothauera lacus]|nr:GNAT family N-acetyltransferase [Pseudothauera lacus]